MGRYLLNDHPDRWTVVLVHKYFPNVLEWDVVKLAQSVLVSGDHIHLHPSLDMMNSLQASHAMKHVALNKYIPCRSINNIHDRKRHETEPGRFTVIRYSPRPRPWSRLSPHYRPLQPRPLHEPPLASPRSRSQPRAAQSCHHHHHCHLSAPQLLHLP